MGKRRRREDKSYQRNCKSWISNHEELKFSGLIKVWWLFYIWCLSLGIVGIPLTSFWFSNWLKYLNLLGYEQIPNDYIYYIYIYIKILSLMFIEFSIELIWVNDIMCIKIASLIFIEFSIKLIWVINIICIIYVYRVLSWIDMNNWYYMY